jgi:endonuclease YncB( thermonuclease family)
MVSIFKIYLKKSLKFLLWLISAFLLLLSVFSFSESFISGIIFLIASTLSAPITDKKIAQFFQVPNKKAAYPIAVLTLFFAGITLYPQTSTGAKTPEKQETTIATNQDQEKENRSLEDTTNSDVLLTYEVTEIIDGDTFKANIDGNIETIRIVGIEAPETKHPSRPVECLGEEATQKLAELIRGKNIALETDETQSNRDRYGRLLRFIFLEDGTDVGLELIKQGYANESLYSSTPHKYHRDYVYAESEAKRQNLGLWNESTCPKATTAPAPIPTIYPTTPPTQQPSTQSIPPSNNSSYACDCSKTCGAMSSCDEAYYQLNTCGCSKRDGDSDGVPCESICQ